MGAALSLGDVDGDECTLGNRRALRATHNSGMTLTLVRLPHDAWPELAGLVVRLNRRADGGVHCLHAAQGDDAASHAEELASLAPGEAAFWSVMRGGERVGMVGCRFDAALGRAWTRGPLAVDSGVLEALLPLAGPTMEAALPGIVQFDAFPAADSTPLNEWHAAAGYEAQQLHRVLRAVACEVPPAPGSVRRATAQDLPAMLRLHEALFPAAYLVEADFRKALDAEDRTLLVACGDGGAPVGYLHVQENAADQEAYVDYLGVMESQRGRGVGRALLHAAAQWAVAMGRLHVALTVREDRRSAIGLYLHAGFVELHAGRHWRRQLREPA
jgi:ribosomal protein S18 acetylase RimI-like enzyme